MVDWQPIEIGNDYLDSKSNARSRNTNAKTVIQHYRSSFEKLMSEK